MAPQTRTIADIPFHLRALINFRPEWGDPFYARMERGHRNVMQHLFIGWLLVVPKRKNVRLSFFNDAKNIGWVSEKDFISNPHRLDFLQALLLRIYGCFSLKPFDVFIPCNHDDEPIAQLLCFHKIEMMAGMDPIK